MKFKKIIIAFAKQIGEFIIAALVVCFILNMGIKLYHFSLETMAYNAFKSERSLSYYSYDQQTYDVLKKCKDRHFKITSENQSTGNILEYDRIIDHKYCVVNYDVKPVFRISVRDVSLLEK